jgi:hypothetical protein
MMNSQEDQNCWKQFYFHPPRRTSLKRGVNERRPVRLSQNRRNTFVRFSLSDDLHKKAVLNFQDRLVTARNREGSDCTFAYLSMPGGPLPSGGP